jgi:hypothetical protein
MEAAYEARPLASAFDGAAQVVSFRHRQLVVAVEGRRQQVRDLAGRERQHVHHLEPRRGVAQQLVRAGDVP